MQNFQKFFCSLVVPSVTKIFWVKNENFWNSDVGRIGPAALPLFTEDQNAKFDCTFSLNVQKFFFIFYFVI